MSRPKRYGEFAPEFFKQGPSIPFLDGIRRYRVKYRTRERPHGIAWKEGQIEMTKRRPEDCFKETMSRLRRPELEVEIMRVQEVSAEQPIQTGRTVETVSQKEWLSRMENAKEKTEYERKELLRAKGIWLPP